MMRARVLEIGIDPDANRDALIGSLEGLGYEDAEIADYGDEVFISLSIPLGTDDNLALGQADSIDGVLFSRICS